jgi:sulfide:quinone oxidoreductase
MGKTVLILGGGVGGLVVANNLRKALPRQHRIVLVDREESHLFASSLLWLMIGGRKPDQIRRPLSRLTRKGIEFVRGEIERIDPERREVTVAGRSLSCDTLILSLGAELAAETIPGLADAGHNFYTLEGAEALRDALARFGGGRIVVLTAAPAYKCPAAPYEAAMLLQDHCRRSGIGAAVEIYAAEPEPMGTAGPEVSRAVRDVVESKGIAYHPGHQIVSADPVARLLRFANGAEATYDLLAYVPPHRAPRVAKEAGLVGESGWVVADRHTLATKHEGVYALGDMLAIPLAMGKPLPKSGVFAHAEAEVVARNIARAILGRGKAARFDGAGGCFIETGGGKAGFGAGNFYAEPMPTIRLHPPSFRWHLGKVLFEKYWLWRWF